MRGGERENNRGSSEIITRRTSGHLRVTELSQNHREAGVAVNLVCLLPHSYLIQLDPLIFGFWLGSGTGRLSKIRGGGVSSMAPPDLAHTLAEVMSFHNYLPGCWLILLAPAPTGSRNDPPPLSPSRSITEFPLSSQCLDISCEGCWFLPPSSSPHLCKQSLHSSTFIGILWSMDDLATG